MEGRTKKERREAARRERERILKQQARRKQLWQLATVGAVAVVAIVVIALLVVKPGGSSGTSNASSPLPGIQTRPPPWPPELADLRQRIQKLGLPASASMAANLHHHDLLQIFDHGKPVEVPQSIGINPTAGMDGVRELEYAVRELGFVGAHFYPHWYEITPDHARVYPLFDLFASQMLHRRHHSQLTHQ